MIFFEVKPEGDEKGKKEKKKKERDRQHVPKTPKTSNKGKEKLFEDEEHQKGSLLELSDSLEIPEVLELPPPDTEYGMYQLSILTDDVRTPPKKRKRAPKKTRTALMSKALAHLNKEKSKRGTQRKRMKAQVPVQNVSINMKRRLAKGMKRKGPDGEGPSSAKILMPPPSTEPVGPVNRNAWQYMSVGRRANAVKTYVERYAESNFSLPLESIQRDSTESLAGISKRITEMIYAMEVLRYGLYDDPAVNKADARYKKSLATMEKHAEWIETVGLKNIITCVEKDMPRIEYMKDDIDSFVREMSHHCRDMIDSYPVPPPSRAITTSIFSRQPTSRAKGRKKKGKNSTATSRSTILSHHRGGRGPTANARRSGGASSRATSSSMKRDSRDDGFADGGKGGGRGGGNQRSRRRVGLRPTVSEFMRCTRSLNECPNILVSPNVVET
jgi:hypothetical protein